MIKLIVVGDSGVGKTNIISAFSNPSYQHNNIHVPTIGVDFSSKVIQVENKKIKLQVWDTAGQERFRTITQTYYKGAAGILLVYSVGNRQSFNNIKKWMESIQQKTIQSTKIILIANKIDLPDEYKDNNQVDDLDKKSKRFEDYRVVSKKQGWDLAAEYKIRYHEVSAKLNLKIDQIFYNIAQLINSQLQQQTHQSEIPIKNLTSTNPFKIKHDQNIVLDVKGGTLVKLKSTNGIVYHKKRQEGGSQNNQRKKMTMRNCAC